MPTQMPPDWLAGLEDEELAFIRNFLLCSGSLKEIAAHYGVSYPTVRLRLDRLIQKIQIAEESPAPYVTLLKGLALNNRLDFDTAKVLIQEYKRIHTELEGKL